MSYREIRAIVRSVRKRIKQDSNNPYTVRTKDGDVDRFGQQAYEKRIVYNMLTQPLSTEEFDRLPEGDKNKTWRFAAVLPPDRLDLNEQVEYKGQWFEVRRINDWDSVMSAHIVGVT